MNRESTGAFIDAVYAIAVTILALEIPAELNAEFSLKNFGSMLLNYAMSFIILFAMWQQHRRINQHVDPTRRVAMWLHGVVLMLICLIPRATTLVFDYGSNVMVTQLEGSIIHGAGWNRAELVDLGYIGVVLAADLCLWALARATYSTTNVTDVADIRRSKTTITLLMIAVLALSVLTPVENRYFLLAMPLALIFERELSALFRRLRRTRTA
jgi:uncharacterized membrane protein